MHKIPNACNPNIQKLVHQAPLCDGVNVYNNNNSNNNNLMVLTIFSHIRVHRE